MLTTDSFIHFVLVYQVVGFIFFYSPIIIYYFKSKTFQIHLKLLHYLILIGYSTLGVLVFYGLEYISREPDYGLSILQDPSEFIIINLLFLFFYYMFQSYSWNIIFAHELIIPTETKHEHLVPILKKTNDLMNAKPYHFQNPNSSEYYIPGSFYSRFDQFIQELEEPKGFKIILINSARNLRYLSIFQTILIIPFIIVRSNEILVQENQTSSQMLNFTINLSSTPTNIDALYWFVVIGLLFLFYTMTLSSASENLLLKYEDTFRKAKVDQVFNIPSLNLKKPDLGLDGTKDKLSDKKDTLISQLEEQKRQRVNDVMGILNPKKEEVKQMDPDVLRLEALIYNVRTVLQSTPTHRKISLDELNNYFSKKVKTTPEELESIVFGLISRKEVDGIYNIWDKEYSGGTPARRFVDKTLEFAEKLHGELNSIKVKADGSVEFYFKTEEEEENEKSDTGEEKKSDTEEEGDSEQENINKFDSFQ